MTTIIQSDIDETALTELELFIDNDADLYRQRTIPMILNVARKIKRGTYNPELAPKLWQYLVDDGARKYNNMFGTPGARQTIFNKQVRNELARRYANQYWHEIKEGNYKSLLLYEGIIKTLDERLVY